MRGHAGAGGRYRGSASCACEGYRFVKLKGGTNRGRMTICIGHGVARRISPAQNSAPTQTAVSSFTSGCRLILETESANLLNLDNLFPPIPSTTSRSPITRNIVRGRDYEGIHSRLDSNARPRAGAASGYAELSNWAAHALHWSAACRQSTLVLSSMSPPKSRKPSLPSAAAVAHSPPPQGFLLGLSLTQILSKQRSSSDCHLRIAGHECGRTTTRACASAIELTRRIRHFPSSCSGLFPLRAVSPRSI